jgi:hypothetical protein
MSMTNVTADELTRAISGKHELYEAAIRNGFYLPKFKSGILTETYITDVICGRLYCPKFVDIKLLPCPRPPDKDTLIKYVKEINTPNSKKFGMFDEQHTPNKEWLLAVLSTFRPDLKIFKKDYVAPPRVAKISAKPTINLPSDFLTNLPVSRKKTKAKRLSMITKGKTEAKLERAKHLQEQFKKETIRLDNKIKASKQRDTNRTLPTNNIGWRQTSTADQ